MNYARNRRCYHLQQPRYAMISDYQRQYILDHKEEKRAYDEQYRKLNQDKLRAKHAAYVQRWRNRIRQTQAARYEKNKEVMRLKARERYAKDPKRYIAATGQYTKANRVKVRQWANALARKMRLEALHKYGGVCTCCGEDELGFLTIDHVKEDGAKHRKTISGPHFFRWLCKNPVSGDFQVLCINCNWGKHKNGGVCPHKQPKGTVHANLGGSNNV